MQEAAARRIASLASHMCVQIPNSNGLVRVSAFAQRGRAEGQPGENGCDVESASCWASSMKVAALTLCVTAGWWVGRATGLHLAATLWQAGFQLSLRKLQSKFLSPVRAVSRKRKCRTHLLRARCLPADSQTVLPMRGTLSLLCAIRCPNSHPANPRVNT
jgi:hypothetical protein